MNPFMTEYSTKSAELRVMEGQVYMYDLLTELMEFADFSHEEAIYYCQRKVLEKGKIEDLRQVATEVEFNLFQRYRDMIIPKP